MGFSWTLLQHHHYQHQHHLAKTLHLKILLVMKLEEVEELKTLSNHFASFLPDYLGD